MTNLIIIKNVILLTFIITIPSLFFKFDGIWTYGVLVVLTFYLGSFIAFLMDASFSGFIAFVIIYGFVTFLAIPLYVRFVTNVIAPAEVSERGLDFIWCFSFYFILNFVVLFLMHNYAPELYNYIFG